MGVWQRRPRWLVMCMLLHAAAPQALAQGGGCDALRALHAQQAGVLRQEWIESTSQAIMAGDQELCQHYVDQAVAELGLPVPTAPRELHQPPLSGAGVGGGTDPTDFFAPPQPRDTQRGTAAQAEPAIPVAPEGATASEAEMRQAIALAAEDPNALAMAALSGDAELLDLLVEAGADVNAADGAGMTPLAHAAAANDSDMVKHLLKLGAEPGAAPVERSPLVVAAAVGATDAARALLEHGVSGGAFNFALSVAATRRDDRFVEVLASHAGFEGDDVPSMREFLERRTGQIFEGPLIADSRYSLFFLGLCQDWRQMEQLACFSPEAVENMNARAAGGP